MAQDPVGPTTDGASAPTIQKPAEGPTPSENGGSAATGLDAEAATAPSDDAAAVPEAPAGATEASPGSDAGSASEVANAGGVDAGPSAASEPDTREDSGEIAPDLLTAEEPEPSATTGPAPVTRPQVSSAEASETALRRNFSTQWRPASNPGKLNIAVRALFANAGGSHRIGGRMGGAQVDVGQAWNSVGYGITASAWGGRVFLPRETGAEMNALFGIGPTLSLGRRALVQRGYLDVRVGYDFFYGVVNERRDDPAILQAQAQSSDQVTLVQADNLIPHGPRATIALGLFNPNSRRFVQGGGLAIGYQGLVGSFRGELPFTHMLTLGFSYWLG
jgi:hypothetical protein